MTVDLFHQRIASLYPGIQSSVYRIFQDVDRLTGFQMIITEGLRSMDAQFVLYAKGRQKIQDKWIITDASKIVTNAKPGLSWHNYGLAFDSAFAGEDPYLSKMNQDHKNSLWGSYGKVVKSYGLRWGGDFHLINGVNDKPHAEMTYGLTIDQVLEIYENGGLKSVWAFIDRIRENST